MTEDHKALDRSSEQRQVRDAYGLAFLMVFASTLAIIASGSPIDSALTAGAAFLQVVALVLTLRVSGIRRSWSVVGSVAAFGLLIAALVLNLFGADSARTASLIIWSLLMTTTIWAIGRRLVTYKEVTLQLVMGLLVIYVLVGLLFALSYQMIDVFWAPSLVPEPQGVSGAVYFSFVTLATLGYGDVLPGNDIARAVAIAEALTGQLYLVSVVSLAVSRLGRRRNPAGLEEHE